MAQDGKCGIYGFRNSLNGKWYIGQSINIKERMQSEEYKKQRSLASKKLWQNVKSSGFTNLKLYKDSII